MRPRPSASRVQSRRCSSRIVVAPSRRLQNAAKSCSPSRPRRTRRSRRRGRAGAARPRVAGAQRLGAVRRRSRPGSGSAGAAPRTARRTASGTGADRPHPDVGGQQPGQPRGQPRRRPESAGRSACATWPVACTPASVRPATVSRDGLPQHHRQGVGQHAADGAPARLRRPAGEVRAVVGDVQPDPGRTSGRTPRARRPEWGRRARRGRAAVRTRPESSSSAATAAARSRRPRRPPAWRTRPRRRCGRSAPTGDVVQHRVGVALDREALRGLGRVVQRGVAALAVRRVVGGGALLDGSDVRRRSSVLGGALLGGRGRGLRRPLLRLGHPAGPLGLVGDRLLLTPARSRPWGRCRPCAAASW